MELVRVTEAGAMAAARWIGRGDKEAADKAAVDAMRYVLDSVAMRGVVVIGEGEKDEAPMLYNGEEVGSGEGPEVDVAVDPLEGTRLTALGQTGAISVIAVAERGTMLFPGAAVYMEKIAVGPRAIDAIDITRPPSENVQRVAEALGKAPREVCTRTISSPATTGSSRQPASPTGRCCAASPIRPAAPRRTRSSCAHGRGRSGASSLNSRWRSCPR